MSARKRKAPIPTDSGGSEDMELVRSQPGGVEHRLPHVLFFELRIGSEDFLSRAAGSQHLENHADGDPHPADGRLAQADFRVDGDAVQGLHIQIVAPERLLLLHPLPHRVDLFVVVRLTRTSRGLLPRRGAEEASRKAETKASSLLSQPQILLDMPARALSISLRRGTGCFWPVAGLMKMA
jgi:hypothetical protein